MIELVHTSVPHGLLSGDGGFCTVAATKDAPVALRQRLEQLSSYKHLVSAPGPQYETGNPIAWSHLILQTGEHLLSCVRACDFDCTNRTNRIARHWCFSPHEVPAGTNFADVFLHGAAEELSAPWSGEPRWLPPRSGSPLAGSGERADRRPVAWNALFGESRGPALAAGFAAALVRAVRDGGRGIVFRTTPAADADGIRALGLFADLLALVPADIRPRVVFSTYPAALPAWMPRHLVCLQSGDPALASCGTCVDLERNSVVGAERLPQDADLLHVAKYGRERVPPPTIRPLPSPSVSSRVSGPSRTPVAPAEHPDRTRKDRLVPQTQVKKTKPEDVLLYVLVGAIVFGALLCAWLFFGPSSPMPATEPPTLPTATSTPIAAPATTTTSTTRPPSLSPNPEPGDAPATLPPPEEVEDGTKPHNRDAEPAEAVQPQTPKSPLFLAEKIEFSMPTPGDWKGEKGIWFFYGENDTWETREMAFRTQMGAKSFVSEPKSANRRLAFNPAEQTIYWDFSPKSEQGWFAEGNPVDLRAVYFGPASEVFDVWTNVWAKQTGNKWTECYKITFSGASAKEHSFHVEGQFLDKERVIKEGLAERIAKFEQEIAGLQRNKESCEEQLKQERETLKQLEQQERALNKKKEEISGFREKKRKEKDEETKKRLESQIKQAEAEKDQMPGGQDSPKSREIRLNFASNAVVAAQTTLDRASKALEEKQSEKKSFEEQKNIGDWLKRLHFTVEPIRPDMSGK